MWVLKVGLWCLWELSSILALYCFSLRSGWKELHEGKAVLAVWSYFLRDGDVGYGAIGFKCSSYIILAGVQWKEVNKAGFGRWWRFWFGFAVVDDDPRVSLRGVSLSKLPHSLSISLLLKQAKCNIIYSRLIILHISSYTSEILNSFNWYLHRAIYNNFAFLESCFTQRQRPFCLLNHCANYNYILSLCPWELTMS